MSYNSFKKYKHKVVPDNWKSLVTGNEFPYKQYTTHETQKPHGPAAGLKCLPINEYPFTLTFKTLKPAWEQL